MDVKQHFNNNNNNWASRRDKLSSEIWFGKSPYENENTNNNNNNKGRKKEKNEGIAQTKSSISRTLFYKMIA